MQTMKFMIFLIKMKLVFIFKAEMLQTRVNNDIVTNSVLYVIKYSFYFLQMI